MSDDLSRPSRRAEPNDSTEEHPFPLPPPARRPQWRPVAGAVLMLLAVVVAVEVLSVAVMGRKADQQVRSEAGRPPAR